MLNYVDEQDEPTNAIAIDAFESKHRITLPDSFKQFLLQNNGGRPHPSYFAISGLADSHFGNIQSFYGLNSATPGYDLDTVMEELPSSVPHGIVPIAHTGNENDQLIVDLRKPHAPVKFWDSYPFWGNNIWNESYLYPVAANFAALLASLKTDEEIGLSVRESSEN